MKLTVEPDPVHFRGLAPRGASGLKFHRFALISRALVSRPARGEWIEIWSGISRRLAMPSRPARGEWIEIMCATQSRAW